MYYTSDMKIYGLLNKINRKDLYNKTRTYSGGYTPPKDASYCYNYTSEIYFIFLWIKLQIIITKNHNLYYSNTLNNITKIIKPRVYSMRKYIPPLSLWLGWYTASLPVLLWLYKNMISILKYWPFTIATQIFFNKHYYYYNNYYY